MNKDKKKRQAAFSPKSGIPSDFSSFYASLFPGRWEALAAALLAEESKAFFSDGLIKPYCMSYASLAAARALFLGKEKEMTDSPRILDMCAAPGGKTLVLASSMGQGFELVANELSASRRRRLIAVLDEHLPEEKRRRVRVTGFDGARWSRHEREAFDFILLDAPCSSERHVMASKKSLTQWTPARIRNLAARQWALLSGAWLLLKPAGRLVYSTCALAPAENSGVAKRLLKKYPESRLCLPPASFFAEVSAKIHPEELDCGIGIFPDASCGIGPIFFSVIEKKGEAAAESDV